MFAKIYEKVKQFMKNNWLFVVILLIVVTVTFVKLPYEVEMPGGIIDLDNRVYVNGEKNKIEGSFNMAYVSVVQGSIPHILMGLVLPDWKVVPISETKYENETVEEANLRDKLNLQQSKDFATAVAMDQASIPYTIKDNINYVVHINKKANTTMKVGDNIRKFNGKDVKEIKDITDAIKNMNVGETVNITVLRDGKKVDTTAVIFEENEKKYIGISALTTMEIESDTKVKITSKPSESGPSGGLMMTLMVYSALTHQDLTHGLKVVGTGTISLDGTVGEIGGVKYKLMGAVKNKADVFLVPKDNYEEAMKVKEEKKYDIKIVSVDKFSDAVEYLEGL